MNKQYVKDTIIGTLQIGETGDIYVRVKVLSSPKGKTDTYEKCKHLQQLNLQCTLLVIGVLDLLCVSC